MKFFERIFGGSRPRRTLARQAGKCARGAYVESLEVRVLLSVSVMRPTFQLMHPGHGGSKSPLASAGATGVTPSTMRHAYGVDLASFGGIAGDGTGQTIAIVDAYNEPTIVSDLAAFDAQFGLNAPPDFTIINQSGGTTLPGSDVKGGWGLETALDVEWAHVIAPNAKILLVEASSPSDSNLFAAVDTARKYAGVSVVSMSWGSDETSTDSFNNSHFLTPSGHGGVTFVASSGDKGSYSSSGGSTQVVGYPAVSPNVLGVGGTSLSTDGEGVYSSESGWGHGTSSGTSGGAGGGISKYFSQPSFQSGVVTQSSTRRTVPDVAFDADPNTGVPIYSSYDNGSSTPWQQVGGTSLAAPMWAGVIAIADQGRALVGLGSLNGATETLPMIYALPASDFHDVTSGNNGYAAGAGYDLVTGLGTPVVNKVVVDLVGVVKPAIGSFTINPGFVSQGNSATLTAANVVDLGSAITAVNFYRESNGTAGLQIGADTLVGTGVQNGATWTIDATTADLAAGVYTYYAVAVDAAANSSIASSAVLNVTSSAASNFISGTVLAWNMNGQTSFGTQGLSATTIATGAVNSTGVTRGNGVTTTGTSNSSAWGGKGWNLVSGTSGVTGGDFITFGFRIGDGYTTFLNSIGLNYRRSTAGPANGYWQFQLNSGAWNLIGDFSNEFSSTSTSGAAITPISLTGISALQNLAAGSVVNFRLVPYGASTSSGAWYIYDGGKNTNDLVLSATAVVRGTPQVGSLTASALSVVPGETVTLSAGNVAEVGGVGTITGVNFYIESNDTTGLQSESDILIGPGIQNETTWTLDVSTADLPAGNYTYYAVATDNAGLISAAVSTSLAVTAPPATIVGRHLFYNNSVLDGNDAAAGELDDHAIAADVSPLLPGDSSVNGHVSGFSAGINGVMIDVKNLENPGALTADDFDFRMGTTGDPASWSLAPVPSLTIRALPGIDGAERLTLIWNDGAIVGTWLRVTLKADAQSGLISDDVFYFGSLPGDANGNVQVDFADLVAVAQNYGATSSSGDFNGDGQVGFADLVSVAQNYGGSLALPDLTPVASLLKATSKVVRPNGFNRPVLPFARKGRITLRA